MRVSAIGEFGLIERLRRKIRTDSSLVRGSGDDCAVIKFDRNKYLLFTCDMLVEGVDFRPEDKAHLIGRKALAASISDIAACAGLPRYCLISLALPPDTRVEFLDKLMQGMARIARDYNINIAGGDISRAERLAIDVSMLGFVEKRRLSLRSGAREKEIIFVSGALGGSIRGRHLKFTPRIRQARYLSANFKVGAMIDISDGLIQDLGHILRQSNKGAILYEELIPLAKEARNLSEALYMGEDFELLFTLPRCQAKQLLERSKEKFYPIGEITEKKYGFKIIGRRFRARVIKPRGFRHF